MGEAVQGGGAAAAQEEAGGGRGGLGVWGNGAGAFLLAKQGGGEGGRAVAVVWPAGEPCGHH